MIILSLVYVTLSAGVSPAETNLYFLKRKDTGFYKPCSCFTVLSPIFSKIVNTAAIRAIIKVCAGKAVIVAKTCVNKPDLTEILLPEVARAIWGKRLE